MFGDDEVVNSTAHVVFDPKRLISKLISPLQASGKFCLDGNLVLQRLSFSSDGKLIVLIGINTRR